MPPVMAAEQTPREQRTWPRLLLISVFLALGTLAVYWPVTRHGFVNYDDTDYVTANPYVQAGLSTKGFAWIWHSEVARNWHPVTMLSHMLDCQLYGMKADGHHLTSLLFHLTNAVLLLLLLWRMTGAVWRSAFVAALFALHPLHVESVAWVAERKDVLSTFFFLLTLGAYARYVEVRGVRGEGRDEKSEGRRPKAEGIPKPEARTANHQSPIANRKSLYYCLALAFFALGLMSKPMLVTMPFVLLLLDFWPLRRRQSPDPRTTFTLRRAATEDGHHAPRPTPQSQIANRKSHIAPPLPRLLLEKVPFLLLSAASCVITFRVQQSGGAVLDVGNFPISGRIANALMSYVRYLGRMLWPEGLAALYLRKLPWPSWQVGLAALILIAASLAAIRFARRSPYFAVGWFWYLGTLVPVIGLVQVGMQSMADRYTYIPLIGIFIGLAWGGWELASRWRVPPLTLAILTALVLAACMVVTRKQLAWWADSEALFQRMIAVGEGNYMAHYNMGNLLSREDKLAEAVKQYEAALKAEPNYAEAHNNLGAVLLRQGRFDEAVAHYAAAARIKPDYLYYFNLANAQVDAGKLAEAVAIYQQALRLNPNSSQAHHNLGLALQALGQSEAAMTEFRVALQLQPDYESAEHNLANRLADAGRLDEAIVHYQAAARLDPNHAETYNGLGICYAMQGELPEAERQFREAVRLKPNHAGAQSNLGNALGAQNKLDEAIPHYQKALELDPNDYQTHFNLGLSLLRQGRRDQANAHFTEALRLHPDYPEARKALAELDASPAPR
jgi:protein O-mannosyl-transferase